MSDKESHLKGSLYLLYKLTLENDFLESALTKAGLLSAKR